MSMDKRVSADDVFASAIREAEPIISRTLLRDTMAEAARLSQCQEQLGDDGVAMLVMKRRGEDGGVVTELGDLGSEKAFELAMCLHIPGEVLTENADAAVLVLRGSKEGPSDLDWDDGYEMALEYASEDDGFPISYAYLFGADGAGACAIARASIHEGGGYSAFRVLFGAAIGEQVPFPLRKALRFNMSNRCPN